VNLAVIGLGARGREILESLSRVPGANIVAICDSYQGAFIMAKKTAPKAETIEDYRRVLDRADVQGVFIATPTHQHKAVALAAVQAGKAVYLESPMAHTIEEAKEIARAAKAANGIFQVGQQARANPQHEHVRKFIASRDLGQVVFGRGQWHKKTTWRALHGREERAQALNWRLDPQVSPGLTGEVGIHSLDVANWFFNALPVSVVGLGGVVLNEHKDEGRKVADTVHCVLEYPDGARFAYDATIVSSYDAEYEVFLGGNAAVLVKDQRAWMFKEADSPLLGWEVYARKEQHGDETGIALVADASKQLAEGKIPGKQKPVTDPGKNALFFACEAFANSIREKKAPDCGPLQGLQACVTALKANEAVVTGNKVTYQKEWFTL
jgi:predicted dehydrogenase